ncbi:hypothetical protein [Paenibacillus paeoniae]|uniref:Uncharacterized protein n=1 Tax=Paenibacillus paeoniae TaxID=2292705 RepID=A0A371PJA8_9BACL|nr:hypothetical protein [Paenibacillus paeoniae]REK76296.1 hypothetical protein DX130_04420 [Paenibacillus paeoniae]
MSTNKIFLSSPVSERDFIWMAAYSDGSFLTEYSFDTKQENSFYEIDKEKIIRFGLIGQGMNMYYEVLGGVFKIVGRMVEVIYKDKNTNKEYFLTGNPLTMYNDLIQYKNASIDFDPLEREGTGESFITQYNFGYKTSLDIDGVKFHFKAICCVPYGGNVYLNIRVVADKDFDNGSLVVRKNNSELFEYDAPIIATQAYEFNWEVS